jgi:hypothetical protein
MFVYYTVPAANESTTVQTFMYTTNAGANTVTDHLRLLTVSPRPATIQAVYTQGRGAGLTAISGISVRLMRMATASTTGTAASIRPRDPASQAAVTTAFSGAVTIGATPTLSLSVGFGAAGPGGWVAPNPDSGIYLATAGGANGNIDMLSGSGTVSMNFDATIEHFE